MGDDIVKLVVGINEFMNTPLKELVSKSPQSAVVSKSVTEEKKKSIQKKIVKRRLQNKRRRKSKKRK